MDAVADPETFLVEGTLMGVEKIQNGIIHLDQNGFAILFSA